MWIEKKNEVCSYEINKDNSAACLSRVHCTQTPTLLSASRVTATDSVLLCLSSKPRRKVETKVSWLTFRCSGRQHNQKCLKKRGLFQLSTPRPQAHQWRKSGQEIQGRTWHWGCGGKQRLWLCSPTFLTQPRPASLGRVSPTAGWTLLHESSVKKMTHRCTH